MVNYVVSPRTLVLLASKVLESEGPVTLESYLVVLASELPYDRGPLIKQRYLER